MALPKRLNSIALAALVMAIPATASAQAYQCRVPRASVTLPDARQDGETRQMPVTGYTLALSWSPEFCRPRQESARHARQCGGRNGNFGFIVHGLWPDGARGSWPQWCPTDRTPVGREVNRSLCMIPSTSLIARQWEKHGSCMARNPDTYLRITRILWRSLRWPDFDRLSRKDGLTAGDIRTAFAEANPYWEVEHIGLKVNARGWLQEMRLCYGRDFMPTRCDRGRFGPDEDDKVRIWRGM